MKLTDEEIVLKLNTEFDPEVFSILVERHRSLIKYKCLRYVKNRDVAEDLCQDILIKLYLKMNTFKSGSLFTTWLYSIIHNHCMDYLKKNRKELHQDITEELSGEVGELLEYDEIISDEMSEKLLSGLLDQITPEGKLILLLKYKERKSIKDIQIALNISESAVKMRLSRAKDKINRLYKSIK
jgi:RNA polymerase sigma-70 factor (ECF subfamily)